jgi:signal transduction histidine kinase
MDAVTVAVAGAAAAGLALGPTATLQPHRGATAVALGVLAAVLWWRRRAPGAVAWLTVAGSVALVLFEAVAPGAVARVDGSLPTAMVLAPSAPFAVYAVGAYAGVRRGAWLAVLVLLLLATAPWQQSWVRGRQGVVLIGVPALLGLYVAARRRLTGELRDRAQRAEREQELLAVQAAAQERERLAADMHDVVTHHVSAIVLEAGALSVTFSDDDVRAAAERIRVAGCRALDELREVVRTSPDAQPRPQEGRPPPDLSPLLAAARAAGTAVELVEHGRPVLLTPVIGRTVVRVVQEGLTNARKHARGAPGTVEVRYLHDRVTVTVRTGAAVAAPDPALAASGSGTGLLALRERVELIGGAVRTGPRQDGGFEVHAELPTAAGLTPQEPIA